MPNRLAGSASAYLRQHQDNPVDWYPWGDEAFERAGWEGKPVFLSIGYSSCHWCHVMAHESFEDPGMAELLNRHFVSVKVDREERPDVDEAYMMFVQLLSGRGGWPLSVFLTPQRKPIYGGTYWPLEDRGRYPGFRSICERIAEAWTEHREDLIEAGEGNADALREALSTQVPEATQPRDIRARIMLGIESLEQIFDSRYGGFGAAPKFPPHTAIEFLLKASQDARLEPDVRERGLTMAVGTLEKMSLGGIHDHVGGGFHRYSTDGHWLVPHFEKMLYDNALLLGNYARAANLTGSTWFRSVAQGIREWLMHDMRSPQDLLYSALDADSEGEEGKFYVWTWEELKGLPEGEQFAKAYQCRPDGNFSDEATGHRTGMNILHLNEPSHSFSRQLGLLGEARDQRVRPGLDDKAVVAWNGLAITALVESGDLEMAARMAEAILRAERDAGRLPHLVAQGVPSGLGFLDDYAYFCQGLLALGGRFKGEASRLADEMLERFSDPNGPGLFSSSLDHETLFGSSKPVLDQPLPSANAVAARVLIALGRTQEAARIVGWAQAWMDRAPHGTEAFYAALLELPDEGAMVARPVTVRATMTGPTAGVVELDVASGYHVTANPAPTAWLVPTEILLEGVSGRARYPASADGSYRGEITIPFEISEPCDEFEVVVRFQACTESECLAPQEVRFTMTPQREAR